MLPLCVCVCLCMHGAVMLKGRVRVASRWGVLACDADWQWCDAGCRNLGANELATLPEFFGNVRENVITEEEDYEEEEEGEEDEEEEEEEEDEDEEEEDPGV